MDREKEFADIRAAFDQWEKENAEKFGKERKKEFLTQSGIPVKRLYTPLDLAERGFDYLKDLGFPGQYPYTRGITPTMYRSEFWRVSQYSGHPTPEQSNDLWKAQIAAGQPVLHMAFDLPTQLGYDPDHPMAEGEVGRVGVSMCSLKDWETAFEGINVGEVAVAQVCNAPAAIQLANHLCIAEKQGVAFKDLEGMTQNDILKEYTSRGNFIFAPAQSIRLVADILCYCGQYLPRYQGLQVSCYHYAERGATPVHETAFALAGAFGYLQAAVDRGIEVDAIAPGISFLTLCRPQAFFEEITKLRAMRRLYARGMRDRFKAKKPDSLMGRWFNGAAGSAMHREQYLNNIARATVAAMAGLLSGVQFQGTPAYDEQFGIPTKEAVLTAIRVHHVLSRETGMTDTIDPLAGSYFVESLTSDFEERILEELENIDRQGGIVCCIENGYLQRVMTQDSYDWQRAFERGDILRVGVNCFTSEQEEKPTRIYRADPKIEEQRVAAVRELKRTRNNSKVREALSEIKAMAALEPTADNNLMPPIIEAVRCYATVGEICDALREVWGEFEEPRVF